MTTVSAAGDPTPHADTHMWNGAGSFAGNAWVTPTGGGLISMLNAMRAVLNEPIYVVVACTGGTGLLQNDVGTPSGFWTDTAPGSLINNAIASVNAALATLPFLFMEANSMWGGNIPSTLAGEFAFSLGFALAVLFMGVLRRVIDRRRGYAWAGLLVAIIGMTHGYALLWAGLFSTWELVTVKDWWRRVGALTAIHGLAILIMAFWLFPLLAYAPWTTSYSHVWIIKNWQEILPPILWIPTGIALATLLVHLGLAAFGVRPFPKVLGLVWWATAIGLVFYYTAKAFHVVDIRFFPFMQLGLCLAAAVGLGMLLAMLPAPEIWPLVGALVIPFVVGKQVTFIPSWVKWNYSGFERKGTYPTLKGLIEKLRGTVGDPRVVYEHSPDHEALGTIRVFENPHRDVSAQRSGEHPGEERGTEHDAIPRKQREAMRLHVTQQPLHRDEGHHPGHHEADDERLPVLAVRVAVDLPELVAGGGEHGRDAHQERELGRGRPEGESHEHRREDRGRRARGAGKHRRQHLAGAHPEGDFPGDDRGSRPAGHVVLDEQDQ
jgi:hypothetical protein